MTALTRSQRAVLAEFRRGGTVEQIAARMWLSPNTIKSHLKRIYQAYGVHGRRELMEAVGE